MKELSNEQERKLNEFLAYSRFGGTAEEFTVRTAWKKCLEANGLDSPDAVIIDPDKLDWPSWADGLRILFDSGERWLANEEGLDTPCSKMLSTYEYIPRPVPAWEPKDGAWHWIWKWGSSEKFASDDPSYLDIKSTRIAPVCDFENEKDKPWEFFVSRGEYREAQEV